MTRWARAGSTQKHHKTPGDATLWKDFSNAAKDNSAPNADKINKIQRGRIEKKKHNFKIVGSSKAKQYDFQSSKTKEVRNSKESEVLKGIRRVHGPKLLKNTESTFNEKGVTKDFGQDSFVGLTSAEDYQLVCDSQKEIINFKDEKNNSAFLPGNDNTTNVLTKRQIQKSKRKLKMIEKDIKASQRMSEFEENAVRENCIEGNIPSPDKVTGKKKSSKKRKNRQEEFKFENEAQDSSGNKDVSMGKRDDTQVLKKSTDINGKAQNDGSEHLLDIKTIGSIDTTEVKMTKNQWRKARRKRKFEQLRALQTNQSGDNTSQNPSNQKTSLEKRAGEEFNLDKPKAEKPGLKNPIDKKSTSPLKDFSTKKKLFLKKLQKKRQQNGITLLPAKVECKIYNIKRGLREKGMPPELIKEVIRKERRIEELKFRKTFSNKPCYNCRETGHLLSECPLKLGDTSQATGICFKCGSTEHTSYKCKKKVEGYPLAKCFVCKEEGHISKDCPKNDHGVYIKGGKCALCGNVNHLRKDCPSIKKEEECIMTVDTINEGTSVDAEIIEATPSITKKNLNKRKVVKF